MRWFEVRGRGPSWSDFWPVDEVDLPTGELAAAVFQRSTDGLVRVMANSKLVGGRCLIADHTDLAEAIGWTRAWAESVA